MNNSKLIKTAGVLDRIAGICCGIFKALVIVMLIFALLVALLGEAMYAPGSLTVQLGFVTLQLDPGLQEITGMVKVYTVAALLCAAVSCAMMAYICTLLRQLLAPMKEGRPFERRTPGDLRKIAWAILIGGALNQLLGLVEQLFMVRALPMDRLFSDAVVRSSYEFRFDGGFILVFFLILFLSYIFSYGQSLQQEADNTV